MFVHPLTYSAPPLISDLGKIELKGLPVFRLLRRLSLDLTQPTLHPHYHYVFHACTLSRSSVKNTRGQHKKETNHLLGRLEAKINRLISLQFSAASERKQDLHICSSIFNFLSAV